MKHAIAFTLALILLTIQSPTNAAYGPDLPLQGGPGYFCSQRAEAVFNMVEGMVPQYSFEMSTSSLATQVCGHDAVKGDIKTLKTIEWPSSLAECVAGSLHALGWSIRIYDEVHGVGIKMTDKGLWKWLSGDQCPGVGALVDGPRDQLTREDLLHIYTIWLKK